MTALELVDDNREAMHTGIFWVPSAVACAVAWHCTIHERCKI